MPTPEEEKKKREIFEAMAPRRRERILQKGYDNWNPFQQPKEPFDQIKREQGDLKRTLNLCHRYIAEKKTQTHSTAYIRGVMEICEGIIRNDDRYQGMYEFCCWYKDKKKEKDT